MSGNGSPHYDTERTIVNDEECELPYCPLCIIDKEVRRITVRGLCPETVYNTDSIFTITEEGSLLYKGDHTSIIYFDKDNLAWKWYDRKDNQSVATSLSSENSMLLGVHVFDFSKVKDDFCTARAESKLLKIKLTSCDRGKFTCNDGKCVDIEERCNQISNCRDESDEDNCKMLV